MGGARSAPLDGDCEEEYGKDAADDNASFCSLVDGQPDVGRVDSMQSSHGETIRTDAAQPVHSLQSDAADAAVAGAESPAAGSGSFDVRLVRTGGEAWGFAWHVGAYAAKRLLVAGVDPSSPAGRWSSEQAEAGSRGIERGHELVSVNGITENGSMRRELVAKDEVHLLFQCVEHVEGGGDNRRLKLGPSCRRPAPIAPPMTASQATPSPNPNLAPEDPHDNPVCIKNTFLHVSETEEHGEEFSRSDPFPMSQLAGGRRSSPYTPGCLAGVNLPAHIAKMAAAGGDGLDRSGSSYSGWSTAQSKSSSNSTGDERGPDRGGDRQRWPSTASEWDLPPSPYMASTGLAGSRPLYPTAEVSSPASTSSSAVSPAKVVGVVAASVAAAAASAVSPAAVSTAATPAFPLIEVPACEDAGEMQEDVSRRSLQEANPPAISSPPKAPAMKIKNTFIELDDTEDGESDFNNTCKTMPDMWTPGLLATPIGKRVDMLASLDESLAKEEVADISCAEVPADELHGNGEEVALSHVEPARLSPELLARSATPQESNVVEAASHLEPARLSPEVREWNVGPKARMMIKNTFVEFEPQDDQDSEFGETFKTMPDLWRPGLLASPMAAPPMNLLAAATSEGMEERIADMQSPAPVPTPVIEQKPEKDKCEEECAKDSGSAGEDGNDAADEDAANQDQGEGEAAPKRRKPTRRAGRRARHRRCHAAEARRLAEEAAAAAAGAEATTGEAGVCATSDVVAKALEQDANLANEHRHDKEGSSAPQNSSRTSPEVETAQTGCTGTEVTQSPTRRGGRPPKKSQLAAAASKSLSGVAATADTEGLGLGGGDVAAPQISMTPIASSSSAAMVAAASVPVQISGNVAAVAGVDRGSGGQDQHGDDAADGLLGKRVLIQGLVRQPQFNGEWGKVEAYDPTLQRFAVRISQGPGPGVLAKLRRENLVVPQTLSLKFNDESHHLVAEQTAAATHAAQVPSQSEGIDDGLASSASPMAPASSDNLTSFLQLDELVNAGAWSGTPTSFSDLSAEALASAATAAAAAAAASVTAVAGGGREAAEKWRPTLRPLSS